MAMDWGTIFDEVYPEPGASAAEIARFIASVGQPLGETDLPTVAPFPKDERLHTTFAPFDFSKWVIPNRSLPSAYLALLRWSNGGEFRSGKRRFQFFPAMAPSHGVRAMLIAYHFPQYMPGAMPIALNGGGTFYLFDMREEACEGEYPIMCSHAGNLGWEQDECFPVAPSFMDACRGTIDIDEIRWGLEKGRL